MARVLFSKLTNSIPKNFKNATLKKKKNDNTETQPIAGVTTFKRLVGAWWAGGIYYVIYYLFIINLDKLFIFI